MKTKPGGKNCKKEESYSLIVVTKRKLYKALEI
jgi:hypothetical protein